jgi:hypothetical protein
VVARRRHVRRAASGGVRCGLRWSAGSPRSQSAVLTGRDADGNPFSVRWRPRAVPAERVLRGPRAAGVELADGPASLLCHSLDDDVSTLRSLLVRGTLRTVGDRWELTPTTLTPGLGMSGMLGDARTFRAARKRAARYLRRRALARPSVPWTTIRRMR